MEALDRLKKFENEMDKHAYAASSTRRLLDIMQDKVNKHEPGTLLVFNPQHLVYVTDKAKVNEAFEEIMNRLGGPILRAVLLRLGAKALEDETKAAAYEAQIEACISIPDPKAVFTGDREA